MDWRVMPSNREDAYLDDVYREAVNGGAVDPAALGRAAMSLAAGCKGCSWFNNYLLHLPAHHFTVIIS